MKRAVPEIDHVLVGRRGLEGSAEQQQFYLTDRRCRLAQDPVDRHPRYAERPRDDGGSIAGGGQGDDPIPTDAWLGTGVDTGLLREGDAIGLSFTPHVGLELREHRQHAEKRATGRGRGIDALLDNPQMGTGFLDLVNDVGEVA